MKNFWFNNCAYAPVVANIVEYMLVLRTTVCCECVFLSMCVVTKIIQNSNRTALSPKVSEKIQANLTTTHIDTVFETCPYLNVLRSHYTLGFL